jgi:Tol biopolymer transport system component
MQYLLETEPAVLAHPWSRFTLLLAATAAALLAALGTALFLYFRQQPPERPLVRFQIPAPEKYLFSRDYALSPDGHWLALTLTGEDGGTSLWMRALDSVEMRRLAGTEGASQDARPFWSPDSRFIGFFADGKLKKIDVSGGHAQTLCDAEESFDGSWNRDGVIIFRRARSGIWRVPEAGGTATQIIVVDVPEESFSPSFLPDDRHFLYEIGRTFEATNITFVASLDGRIKKRLFSGLGGSVYAPPSIPGEPGHLLFLTSGDRALMAQPFNWKRLESMAEAFPVAENVASFSASANGALAYRTRASLLNRTQLIWFDRTGRPLAKIGPPGRYSGVALLPDGSRVALARQGDSGNPDIWILDAERDVPTQFTFYASTDWEPVWSPDSKRLAFASRRDHGLDQIYWKNSSGIGNEEAVWKSAEGQRPEAWSPDGKFLLFMHASPKGSIYNLWTLPADPGTPGLERKAAPYFTSPT